MFGGHGPRSVLEQVRDLWPPGGVITVAWGATLAAVDREYDRLWEARASSAFATEEVLRFCAFFFNLKEVAHGLRAMESAIAGGRRPRPPDTPLAGAGMRPGGADSSAPT